MDKSKLKKERKAVYFDLTCGMVSSIISLVAMTFSIMNSGVNEMGFFTMSVTFWIGYLLFSIFMICIGIWGHYKTKKHGFVKSKKALKVPIAN